MFKKERKYRKIVRLIFAVEIISAKENAVQLCEETGAELIGHFGDSANNLNLNLNLKLVAWYTGLDNPNAYAIVLPNSKIQLIR